ncbi:hypothetical protein [Catenuloplanes indicus]|uniref:Uncharacterized protein n=1 Tax=Catenuloplanes indicus TaxID=137267 RepID=A0AAE3VUK6_9ACTN|nr:hypothetical protein [Catenuloplanes indicus]MDQ0363340.1 hypothetical protein [Catenuloplanes indicus]MDQ0371662.1 hypothetical protein [Catenuloplanes indicus]
MKIVATVTLQVGERVETFTAVTDAPTGPDFWIDARVTLDAAHLQATNWTHDEHLAAHKAARR